MPELKQQLRGKIQESASFLAPAFRCYLCGTVPLFFQPTLWEPGFENTQIYLNLLSLHQIVAETRYTATECVFLVWDLHNGFGLLCVLLVLSPLALDCIWIYYRQVFQLCKSEMYWPCIALICSNNLPVQLSALSSNGTSSALFYL